MRNSHEHQTFENKNEDIGLLHGGTRMPKKSSDHS